MGENNFSFKTIIQGFLDAFNIERGIIPTFRDLFLAPDKVINYYIEGHRGKYFVPGRFFVTILALLSFIAYITGGFDPELFKSTIVNNFSDSEFSSKNEENLLILNTTIEVFMQIFNNGAYRLPLLILPSAFISWIVFYKYRFNLAKHFVIHIYCWCFISLILALLGLSINQKDYFEANIAAGMKTFSFNKPWQYVLYEWSFYLTPVIYYVHALRGVFKLNGLGIITRPFFFTIISIITLYTTSVIIGVILTIYMLS